uniref:P-type phospholipid transporter n=1 Tax=Macrostomum lignano TaxID=282301 RepID=A0A1I8GGX4_9PLAT
MRSASSICKSLRARITCEQPTTDLYKFKGNMVVRHKSRPYDKVTLSVKNLLLRGAVLRNTEYAIGVAVYTGQETKMQLNSQHVRPKKSVIERRLDKFLLFFMIALLIESIFCTAMKWGYATLDGTVTGAWYVSAETATPWRVIQDLLGFIVLFNYLIPISLYVTIELQKFIGSIFFGFDLDMYFEDPETGEKLRAKANTSDLNEELGQEMLHRQAHVSAMTTVNYGRQKAVCGRKLSRRETLDGQELLFFTILALCHTIRVERPKSFDRDSAALAPNDRRYTASEAEVYTYQASSPDEKAFAEAARNYGVIFHGTESGVSILSVTSDGEEVIHRYRILHVLEFDSDRKCMSVILQRSNGTYWLLTKGAESSMLEKCSTGDRDSVVQYSGELALEGLRVLVIAHKELTEEEYRQMSLQLLSAEQDVANREERLIEAYKSVECNLEAVGLTAIEDELQSGVCETITALRDAGIQVWVLTGDKRETAENISLSAGHFTESMQRIRIIDQQSAEGCRESLRCGLEEIETGGSPLSVQYCVVVDGQSLQFLVANEYSELKDSFLELCRRTSAVLCCRCTPLQKARVVSMVRNGIKPEPTTCAIGDGANDVSMIREAHVGIGIFGKEGRAAALNSDYCFAKFRFSRNALLFHGHLYYVRLAVLVLFFFYKNVAFITAELYYAFFSAFTAQSVYDTLFLTIYNMTMTALPQHLPRHHRLESEPSLYRNIAQNRKLWWRELGGWCTIGLWHSVCCFFGVAAVFLVNDWVGTNGFVFDVYAFGTVVVYCVLACVTARILIVTFSFNVPALIGLLVTAIGFVLVLCIYSVSTVTLLSNHLTFLWAYFDISLQPISWLLLLCVSVLALTPDIILRSMQDIRTDRLLRRRGTAGELPAELCKLRSDPSHNYRVCSIATAKLKNRRLTDDAVPCIFPNVASYLSKAVLEERQTAVCTSAESRRENDIQRCEVEAEELLQKDVISDFHAIGMSGAGNLEIATLLNVGQELLFEVTVGGDKQASFAGDLVADGSLKTFAQLENILARLKNVRLEDCRHGYKEHLLLAQEAVTKAITDLSAKIEVKSDQELDTSIEEAAFAKLNFLVEQLSFSTESDLEIYAERMNQYFICNKVETAEAKRAIFLTAIGEKYYKLLRDLCQPQKLTEKSYEDLQDILKKHCSPEPSEIAARFKFQQRLQQDGESFANFLAGLKNAANHCKFGESLQERLRDQFLFGMRSDNFRSKLLESSDHSYAGLIKLALDLEAAHKSSSEMAHTSATNRSPILVPLQIEEVQSHFELDTGSAVSLVPKAFYDSHLSHLRLHPSKTTLRTYTDQEFSPIGEVTVKVTYEGQEASLPLLVVSEGSARLLGRNWLTVIRLDWPRLTAPVNSLIAAPNDMATELVRFGKESGWLPGVVVAASQRNYDVRVGTSIVRRHVDQMLPDSAQPPPSAADSQHLGTSISTPSSAPPALDVLSPAAVSEPAIQPPSEERAAVPQARQTRRQPRTRTYLTSCQRVRPADTRLEFGHVQSDFKWGHSAPDLQNHLTDCLALLDRVHLKPVLCIVDNNAVNRSLFQGLLCKDKLQSSIPNPLSGEPLFLLFDPVHNFKNILNNWISRQTCRGKFCAPISTLHSRRCARNHRPIAWRHKSGCVLSCGRHQHFSRKANPCPKTCDNHFFGTPRRCYKLPKAEGCRCNKGYVLDGTKCVKPKHCECLAKLCIDRVSHHKCRHWKAQGRCRRYPEVMGRFCRLTCGMCTPHCRNQISCSAKRRIVSKCSDKYKNKAVTTLRWFPDSRGRCRKSVLIRYHPCGACPYISKVRWYNCNYCKGVQIGKRLLQYREKHGKKRCVRVLLLIKRKCPCPPIGKKKSISYTECRNNVVTCESPKHCTGFFHTGKCTPGRKYYFRITYKRYAHKCRCRSRKVSRKKIMCRCSKPKSVSVCKGSYYLIVTTHWKLKNGRCVPHQTKRTRKIRCDRNQQNFVRCHRSSCKAFRHISYFHVRNCKCLKYSKTRCETTSGSMRLLSGNVRYRRVEFRYYKRRSGSCSCVPAKRVAREMCGCRGGKHTRVTKCPKGCTTKNCGRQCTFSKLFYFYKAFGKRC